MFMVNSMWAIVLMLLALAAPCQCDPCPAGSYQDAGHDACALCSFGRFSSAIGATSSMTCASCPEQGQFSSEGSSNLADCHFPDTSALPVETIALRAVCLDEVNSSQAACNEDAPRSDVLLDGAHR